MNTRALRGLNDPLSVDNKPFYTFYRTLKRWTTGTLYGFGNSGQKGQSGPGLGLGPALGLTILRLQL